MPAKAPTALDLARSRVRPTEDQEQTWLIEWARLQEGRTPELALLFAVPNESGNLPKATRGRLQRLGKKAGVPDLVLPVPRGSHHGLFIEMKRVGWTPSDVRPDQRRWHDALWGQGYYVAVCGGFEDAKQILLDYLAGRFSP